MAYAGPMTPEDAEFDEAMLQIYSELGKHGYFATYFLLMLRENGGIETARRLLDPMRGLSEGFLRIVELGRLDLSVEALVLRQQFRPLFKDAELTEARRRLRSANFDVDSWEDEAE